MKFLSLNLSSKKTNLKMKRLLQQIQIRFYTIKQSPNMPTPWSSSQAPKQVATNHPRFEQTLWEYQVFFIN
jgi:hypothetical protein